jgi:hypothetical protein
MMVHCRFQNRAAWTRFTGLLRDGWSWEPITVPGFGIIRSFLNGGGEPTIKGPSRETLIFDTMLKDHGALGHRGQQLLMLD